MQNKNFLYLCALILFTAGQAFAAVDDEVAQPQNKDCSLQSDPWSTLPVELFQPLLAIVREPQFSIRNEKYKGGNGNFDAAQVSFGDYLPVVGYHFEDNTDMQFSIDGAMFAIYNLDKESYDLFNTDYHFGLSTSYKDGPLSYRFRVYHVSSHLGDEYLQENPNSDRKNSSYEDSQLIVAYTLDELRFYLGGGVVLRSNSLEHLDPLSGRTGFEYRHPLSSHVDFLTSLDLSTSQRTKWNLTRSVMTGFSILKNETKDVRLMANYYGGNSPQGQFFKENIEYVGFGIYFIV